MFFNIISLYGTARIILLFGGLMILGVFIIRIAIYYLVVFLTILFIVRPSMSTACRKTLLATTLFTFAFASAGQNNEIATTGNSIWSEMGRIIGFLLNRCLITNNQDFHPTHRDDNAAVILEDCLKRRGLRALDRALSRDIIEITDNVVLVKWKNETEFDGKNDRSWNQQEEWGTQSSLKTTANWNKELIEKISRFIKSRVVKITFKGLSSSALELEARHRKNNAFGQMLMFGLVAAGLIVIPMGFQFLAVLGGKALLLAKLALLLTSIQGLKKIATSPVNYGLYSTGPCKSPCSIWLVSEGYGSTGLIDYWHFTAPQVFSGEGDTDGDGHDDGVDFGIDVDDSDASNLEWHYDRKWHYEPDPYPPKLYSASLGTHMADHYLPSSVLPPSPVYSSILNPREEDSLGAY